MEIINYTNVTNAELYNQYAELAVNSMFNMGATVAFFVAITFVIYFVFNRLAIERGYDWVVIGFLISAVPVIITIISGIELAHNVSQYNKAPDAYINSYIIEKTRTNTVKK